MNERIGDGSLIFGIVDEGFGYMQAKKIDHSPTLTEALNGQNGVVAGEFSHDMQAVSYEYIFRNVSADPFALVGSDTPVTFEDTGLAVYIKTGTKSWANADWIKISGEGVYYPDLGS